MALDPGRARLGVAVRLGAALIALGASLSAMHQQPAQDVQQQQAQPPQEPPPDPSLALLSGRVVDDKNAPVAGSPVRAMRVRSLAGRTQFDVEIAQTGKVATTDADGNYKMSVSAGRYAVEVPSTPTHATIFYPVSRNASGAVMFSLEPGGAQAGIDFVLPTSHTVKVSGTLTGSDAIANVLVRLESEEFGDVHSDLDALSATTNATGQFTFPFVHPGRYRARVRKSSMFQQARVQVDPGGVRLLQQPAAPALMAPRDGENDAAATPVDAAFWADVSVEVPEESTGIDNLDIWLQPGPHVSGRIVFQGSAIRPAGVSLKTTSVVLVPVDDRDQPAAIARIEDDDEVHLPAVLPGRYAVALVPALAAAGGGWTLASICAGGRDITGLVTEVTSDVSDLTITLSNTPASAITGTVRFPHGTNPAGITVYVFPADHAVWSSAFDPAHLVWFRTAKPDPLGTFALFVRPGSYLVAAVAGTSAPSWTDPDSLADLAGSATLVRVDASPGRPLDLVMRGR